MAGACLCAAPPAREAALSLNCPGTCGRRELPMNANKERILLVEDEPAMRIALQDALEAEGYRVLTAIDGRTGLERALKEKPALLLLDVMLPQLNGFEVCAELRRLANQIPVLMLTAKG